MQELGWGRSTDAIRLEMHLFLTATYSAKCFNISLQCGRVLEWAPGIYDNSWLTTAGDLKVHTLLLQTSIYRQNIQEVKGEGQSAQPDTRKLR